LRYRYYPGFFGALFLVLLRLAIGWHFLYEGLWKYEERDGRPFSAEGYFRASAGPLATNFRALIPDPNALEKLERDAQGLPVALKKTWAENLDRYAANHGFNADDRARAEDALKAAEAQADTWFRNRDNAWKVKKYMADLRKVMLTERDPEARTSQRELAWKDRLKLGKERNELVGTLDGWSSALYDKWAALVPPERLEADAEPASLLGLRYDFRAPGPMTAVTPMSRLDWMNTLTIYGLIIAGACLILGLLTPLAALWCAGFLALIYLSLPPWPGLPDNPISEGHYWIVNKNLIEMLACLVLAATPSGLWIGLDALLFGWIDRRRAARDGGVDSTVEELVSDRTRTTPEPVRPGAANWRERR
jgi:uncharacterized membrane protein YphA (DoxX/SURF4 family)